MCRCLTSSLWNINVQNERKKRNQIEWSLALVCVCVCVCVSSIYMPTETLTRCLKIHWVTEKNVLFCLKFDSRFNVLFIFLSHCKDSISVPFQTNTFRSFTQRRNLYLEEQRKVGVHLPRNYISCSSKSKPLVKPLRFHLFFPLLTFCLFYKTICLWLLMLHARNDLPYNHYILL